MAVVSVSLFSRLAVPSDFFVVGFVVITLHIEKRTMAARARRCLRLIRWPGVNADAGFLHELDKRSISVRASYRRRDFRLGMPHAHPRTPNGIKQLVDMR